MKILSILWSQCSTAALMVDGEIVACTSEERFSRQKNDERYPRRAIEYVLAEAGVNPGDLDLVVHAGEVWSPRYMLTRRWSTFSAHDRLREQREYWYPVMYEGKTPAYYDLFADKLDLAQYPGDWDRVLRFEREADGPYSANSVLFYQEFRRQVTVRHLGIAPDKVEFVHHHRAHGYYAYYGSPLRGERVLILTADAWGDDMNASVSVVDDGRIRLLSTSTNFLPARLYRSMTMLLGMKPDEHEYKLMGLAAYAKPAYYQGPLDVFRATQHVDGLGFDFHTKPSDLYVYFRDRLEGYRFDSIAGALQRYVEEILCTWTANALAVTGARRLVFGGGVAMNVKAMMHLGELPGLDDLFVCVTPSDESLAPGAAYVAMHDWCERTGRAPAAVLKPLAHAYLGPPVAVDDVCRTLSRARADGRYVVTPQPGDARVAHRLAEGRILGRCVGRSEFGARALGNRSIIADPRNPTVVRSINEAIKSRDFWMPFAPTVLDECADTYLVNPKHLDAPYMTLAFPTTANGSRDLLAGLHQADLTCRPQILSRTANPDYYGLISQFRSVTGVGGVLNTSFNFHGEPIVQTAEEAFRVFEQSGLDMLLLDGALIEKRQS